MDLELLAKRLRDNPALGAKSEIALVGEVLGGGDWRTTPGDDGAIVTLRPSDARAVVCGEALLPAFVAHDPYGAGLAAVVANVNDVAAMGGVPEGIVDTIIGPRDVAAEILRGLRFGSELYRVPLVGGHLTINEEATPALSAFAVGGVGRDLSMTRAEAGHQLIVAACVDGTMRPDFPFFASFEQRGDRLADDIRLLPTLAESGAVVAAKDVSMAGLVGSLAMLLEARALGTDVHLAAVPRPGGVPLADWLLCFPAFAFLLCSPADRAVDAIGILTEVGLAASVVGEVNSSGQVAVVDDGRRAVVLDLGTEIVTGLPRSRA